MNTLSYREISPQDYRQVLALPLVRNEIREVTDGSGVAVESTEEAVSLCLAFSRITWVIEEAGYGIIGIFGLGGQESVAFPWLLGTDRLFSKWPKALVVGGRKVLRDLAPSFPRLINRVYVGDTRAVKWLKALGFVFPDLPLDVINGRSYLTFYYHYKEDGDG